MMHGSAPAGGPAAGASHRGSPLQQPLFPVEPRRVETAGRPGLSRGTRQRIGRRRLLQQEAARCVSAVNALGGYDAGAVPSAPSAVQGQFLERVDAGVRDMWPQDVFFQQEEALRTLLRGVPGYELGDASSALAV